MLLIQRGYFISDAMFKYCPNIFFHTFRITGISTNGFLVVILNFINVFVSQSVFSINREAIFQFSPSHSFLIFSQFSSHPFLNMSGTLLLLWNSYHPIYYKILPVPFRNNRYLGPQQKFCKLFFIERTNIYFDHSLSILFEEPVQLIWQLSLWFSNHSSNSCFEILFFGLHVSGRKDFGQIQHLVLIVEPFSFMYYQH